MQVRVLPATRQPLASGNAVVAYVTATRRFWSLSAAVEQLLAEAERSGSWPDDQPRAARELVAAGLLAVDGESAAGPLDPPADAPDDDPPGDPLWVRPMRHQLATPLQTPFDPSGPDAWEEPPRD